MSQFVAELMMLVERCRTTLLDSPPVLIEHFDLEDLGRNQLPVSLGTQPINLYAIWSRPKGTTCWELHYIGQRSEKYGWRRVREHLFHAYRGTESKVERVREALRAGREFGVTAMHVEPDFLRLSIEDELIRRVSRQQGALPWNKRSRAKKTDRTI